MKRLLAAVLLAVIALSGCAHQPVVGKVTYKTIERPYVSEECGGFPVMCWNEDVPTKYRVEITYPPRFDTEEGEWWCYVDPHDYERTYLGQKVLVQDDCIQIEWKNPTTPRKGY